MEGDEVNPGRCYGVSVASDFLQCVGGILGMSQDTIS